MASLSVLIFLTASAQATATATPVPAAEKLICKRVDEDTTGSRLAGSRRVCRTAYEWRAFDAETQRALNKTKDKGMAEPFAHESQGR